MEKIYTEHGVINEIAEEVGCNRMTVSNALNGKRKESNKLQRKIRKVAMSKYGGRMRQRVAPKWGYKIDVPHGALTAMSVRFEVAPVTIRKALQGYEGSRTAQKIRKAALEDHGGVRVDSHGKMIDRTRFFGGMMVQYFANGITIEADRETGYVRMFRGKTLLDWKVNPSIEDLMKMQEKAMQIAGESDC